MSIHDGHRQRIKDRYIRDGLENFEPHQILELLLFYAIPRRDTNEIAHNLMKHFGTLDRIFDAPLYELEKVEGMGKGSAAFLTLVRDVCRAYEVSKAKKSKIVMGTQDYANYLFQLLRDNRNEVVYLLCLNGKREIIGCYKVATGDIHSVQISTRNVIERALACNASFAVLAHNHPSGFAIPSGEDNIETMKIKRALESVGVELLDHLVAEDTDYIVYSESGYQIFCER